MPGHSVESQMSVSALYYLFLKHFMYLKIPLCVTSKLAMGIHLGKHKVRSFLFWWKVMKEACRARLLRRKVALSIHLLSFLKHQLFINQLNNYLNGGKSYLHHNHVIRLEYIVLKLCTVIPC